ncbi:MAG: hypothetical protein QNL45_05800 [Nitrospirota bacterium]|nr:hypothetical protein [Nitrospirota bacterium]
MAIVRTASYLLVKRFPLPNMLYPKADWIGQCYLALLYGYALHL